MKLEDLSNPMIAGSIIAGIGLVWIVATHAQRWINRWRVRRQQAETEQAVRSFRMQREMLEAKFFDLAGTLGKPRGLRWLDCDWLSDVTFARACDTGLLTAFVAVNIRFEAVPGGDMEGVAAVDTIRDAAAVFHFQRGRWTTGGKALFNMNPTEALSRLAGQFQPIEPST